LLISATVPGFAVLSLSISGPPRGVLVATPQPLAFLLRGERERESLQRQGSFITAATVERKGKPSHRSNPPACFHPLHTSLEARLLRLHSAPPWARCAAARRRRRTPGSTSSGCSSPSSSPSSSCSSALRPGAAASLSTRAADNQREVPLENRASRPTGIWLFSRLFAAEIIYSELYSFRLATKPTTTLCVSVRLFIICIPELMVVSRELCVRLFMKLAVSVCYHRPSFLVLFLIF
jgi:hypothetical protein